MARPLDNYLGSFADDATVNAYVAARSWSLQPGHLYLDSTLGIMKAWNGSAWVMTGLAPDIEDMRISAFAPRTSAPTLATFSSTPAGVELESWQFANNTVLRGLDGFTQLSHSWLPGTDASVHLHLSTTSAVGAAVDIGLFCAIMIQKIGVDLASAWIKLLWLKKTSPGGGYGAKTHIYTDEYTIPAAQLQASCMIFVHPFRHKGTPYVTDNAGSVTENINDVLWLHEVDVHYTAGRFGVAPP